jgi:cytochrome c-type biogenesis protein CcmH
LNIQFLIIAGCLVLIALAFVLPPLWRIYPVADSGMPDDQDQRNILIARQRLSELQEQRQTGALSQSQYDEQFAELEQALSDDLDILNHASVSKSQGHWMVYLVALLVPLLAGSLYLTLGNVQAISHSVEMASADPETPSVPDINLMIAGLAERLKADPNDAQGWLMLGRSYKYLEQYPQAVDAFANAYRLLGDQAEVMLLYAEAIAYGNNKNLTGKPAELITKALALEPENLNALWLGGMVKAQQNDSPAAIKMWRKLEALLPPGSEARHEMQTLLAKMGSPVSKGAGQSAQTSNKSTVSVDVDVSLAPALQKSVKPADTVFIYAQALSGPKMPIAIVRKQVADLPVTVNLNDTMAMMPEVKLSNFDKVKLLARISKSGNAMTQAGDLLGVIEQAELSAHSRHKIVINRSKV